MKNIIKLAVLASAVLLLSGCGSTYVYKPISYMSPTKTYEEAEAYCKRVVKGQLGQISSDSRRKSELNVERMRSDRIAYARANPVYNTSINCNRFGRNVNCSGSSTPSSYSSYSGYNTAESAARSGAALGDALGKLLARPGMMKECMASEGYEKVKVEEGESQPSSYKSKAVITKVKIYQEAQCIKSSPWGNNYQCNDGDNQFNGEGSIVSNQFYPTSLLPTNTIKTQTKSDNKSSYWGEKFYNKGDEYYKKRDFENAIKYYKKSLDKGFSKAKRSLLKAENKQKTKLSQQSSAKERVAPVVTDINTTGNWNGTWISTNGKDGGSANLTLIQKDFNLTGLFSIKDSPCLKSGSITGEIFGSKLLMNIASGSHKIEFSANDISSKVISGSYITTNGKCKGSKGSVILISNSK
jgi:hypothetical protein